MFSFSFSIWAAYGSPPPEPLEEAHDTFDQDIQPVQPVRARPPLRIPGPGTTRKIRAPPSQSLYRRVLEQDARRQRRAEREAEKQEERIEHEEFEAAANSELARQLDSESLQVLLDAQPKGVSRSMVLGDGKGKAGYAYPYTIPENKAMPPQRVKKRGAVYPVTPAPAAQGSELSNLHGQRTPRRSWEPPSHIDFSEELRTTPVKVKPKAGRTYPEPPIKSPQWLFGEKSQVIQTSEDPFDSKANDETKAEEDAETQKLTELEKTIKDLEAQRKEQMDSLQSLFDQLEVKEGKEGVVISHPHAGSSKNSSEAASPLGGIHAPTFSNSPVTNQPDSPKISVASLLNAVEEPATVPSQAPSQPDSPPGVPSGDSSPYSSVASLLNPMEEPITAPIEAAPLPVSPGSAPSAANSPTSQSPYFSSPSDWSRIGNSELPSPQPSPGQVAAERAAALNRETNREMRNWENVSVDTDTSEQWNSRDVSDEERTSPPPSPVFIPTLTTLGHLLPAEDSDSDEENETSPVPAQDEGTKPEEASSGAAAEQESSAPLEKSTAGRIPSYARPTMSSRLKSRTQVPDADEESGFFIPEPAKDNDATDEPLDPLESTSPVKQQGEERTASDEDEFVDPLLDETQDHDEHANELIQDLESLGDNDAAGSSNDTTRSSLSVADPDPFIRFSPPPTPGPSATETDDLLPALDDEAEKVADEEELLGGLL
jgi:hypothetical protein